MVARLAVAGLVVASGIVAVSGQGRPWVQSRTPDGQPDLQGFWSNSTYVPLERPNGVTKEFYTPEEAVARSGRPPSRASEAQTTPGTVEDIHYDFSQFGLDRSQAAQAPNLRTSLIVDPPDGKVPPMTEEGRSARGRARRGAEGRRPLGLGREQPARRSVPHHGRRRAADDGRRLQQQLPHRAGAGYVMILTEMIHDVRIIPLDGRPAPPGSVRQWMGTSRGRWEGDTLVVETTNFNGKNPFRNSSERMRVTERFTRVSDEVIVLPLHDRRSGDLVAAVDR